MRKLIDFLFSLRFTVILLLVFATALGIATFIEERYDTITARLLVYNAHWFELLMLLMVVNFTGNITKYKMISWKKWPLLMFHLAFIMMILGAGLTRYLGFEGNMHLKEGGSTSVIYTEKPFLQVIVSEKDKSWKYERPLIISEYLSRRPQVTIKTGLPEPLKIKVKDYFTHSVEKMVEHVPGGSDIIEILYATGRNQFTVMVKKGASGKAGPLTFGFENPDDSTAIQVKRMGGNFVVTSPYPMLKMDMHAMPVDTIEKGIATPTEKDSYFDIQGFSFLVKQLYQSAATRTVKGTDQDDGPAALTLDVAYGDKTKEITVLGGPGFSPRLEKLSLGNIEVQIGYGDNEMQLPFELRLDDFVLERYPGSDSPSSYSSQVTVIDKERSVTMPHRIFMNNVLDYRGYRFFQSSYEPDEKGSILSVNHDKPGTLVTYAGYFFMTLGFILTLFNRKSHFRKVNRTLREQRIKWLQATTILLFLMFAGENMAFSQQTVRKPVDAAHAEQFGELLVQTFDGRIQPLHTLAYDLMHKISRKDHFTTTEKGNLSAVQVMMDLVMDGEYWKQQPIVYVRDPSVRQFLHIQGKYATLVDFYSQEGYKLTRQVEEAFRKKPGDQNVFDKEVLKVDERVNLLNAAREGRMFKLFPVPGEPQHPWLAPGDSMILAPVQGNVAMLKEELGMQQITYFSLLQTYFQRLVEQGTATGDYSQSGKILAVMKSIQRQDAPAEILPSERMIRMETFYNNAEIFIKLRNWYGFLAMVFLFLAFVDILRKKKSKVMDWIFRIITIILGIAFLYHTFGLGLRWYLSGHAPWSNGYEALLLMAWASLLAGFIFNRYSRITLASTVLLAAAMLMTASHSSYDPQLTNLQPVLKSYWLIIHVAVITISYGFLGLGFALGLIHHFLSVFSTRANRLPLDPIKQELTYINEMTLTVGLFLATVGTFLGGIWANESWGRYWGWDSKETWALIIVITYTIILHFRLIPRLKSAYALNTGAILGFGSVLMTFIGVNYYLSKGLHSYAAGDTPVFPVWAWVMILAVIALIVVAGIKESLNTRQIKDTGPASVIENQEGSAES